MDVEFGEKEAPVREELDPERGARGERGVHLAHREGGGLTLTP